MKYQLLLILSGISVSYAAVPQDSTVPLLPTITTQDIQCKKVIVDPNQTTAPVSSGANQQQMCPSGYVPGGVTISNFPAGTSGAAQTRAHWFYDNKNPTLTNQQFTPYHSGNTTYYSVPGAPTLGVPPFNNNSADPIWYRNKINNVTLICVKRIILFTPGPCTN